MKNEGLTVTVLHVVNEARVGSALSRVCASSGSLCSFDTMASAIVGLPRGGVVVCLPVRLFNCFPNFMSLVTCFKS